MTQLEIVIPRARASARAFFAGWGREARDQPAPSNRTCGFLAPAAVARNDTSYAMFSVFLEPVRHYSYDVQPSIRNNFEHSGG